MAFQNTPFRAARACSLSALLATGLLLGTHASADDLCNVPEADRQPVAALQQQLESKGWEVKNIKIDDGCYEAYAIDETGARVESYFDPQTFEVVKEM